MMHKPAWLMFQTGRWWYLAVCTPHLAVEVGWNFVRNCVGITLSWGRNPDKSPYTSGYKATRFIRVWSPYPKGSARR